MPFARLHHPSGIPPHAPLFLTGPTAVGKSEVALLLAEGLGGEIISADSMQVYRGLDIGTAKPGAAERARIPHHLLDVVELTEPFDAAKFVALARAAIEQVQAGGHRPILCGGTGLYFKALLEGLGEAPSGDSTLRAELEAAPLADLLRELAECDPATFARIDRRNARRVVRAVEVIRLTGKPFSTQRASWREGKPPDPTEMPLHFFALSRDGKDLRVRIDSRVDQMFSQGLVSETKRLLEHGLARNKTAIQAIGYRQVVEHLQGGRSLAETVALVKTRTRQFAKRQMTWFRHQLSVTWVDVRPDESAAGIAARLEALMK